MLSIVIKKLDLCLSSNYLLNKAHQMLCIEGLPDRYCTQERNILQSRQTKFLFSSQYDKPPNCPQLQHYTPVTALVHFGKENLQWITFTVLVPILLWSPTLKSVDDLPSGTEYFYLIGLWMAPCGKMHMILLDKETGTSRMIPPESLSYYRQFKSCVSIKLSSNFFQFAWERYLHHIDHNGPHYIFDDTYSFRHNPERSSDVKVLYSMLIVIAILVMLFHFVCDDVVAVTVVIVYFLIIFDYCNCFCCYYNCYHDSLINVVVVFFIVVGCCFKCLFID